MVAGVLLLTTLRTPHKTGLAPPSQLQPISSPLHEHERRDQGRGPTQPRLWALHCLVPPHATPRKLGMWQLGGPQICLSSSGEQRGILEHSGPALPSLHKNSVLAYWHTHSGERSSRSDPRGSAAAQPGHRAALPGHVSKVHGRRPAHPGTHRPEPVTPAAPTSRSGSTQADASLYKVANAISMATRSRNGRKQESLARSCESPCFKARAPGRRQPALFGPQALGGGGREGWDRWPASLLSTSRGTHVPAVRRLRSFRPKQRSRSVAAARPVRRSRCPRGADCAARTTPARAGAGSAARFLGRLEEPICGGAATLRFIIPERSFHVNLL